MKRFFYVLRVNDEILNDCIEAIRYFCDPHEKHQAHITVRGPYVKKIAAESLTAKIAGQVVLINGVGHFFDSGQNTVFFLCSCDYLRAVWSKPDYAFNPHITVYDSSSRDFALRVYAVLRKYEYNLMFHAGQLELLRSSQGQKSLSLALAFNSRLISAILGEQIDAGRVMRMSPEARLSAVDKICGYLAATSGVQNRAEGSRAVAHA